MEERWGVLEMPTYIIIVAAIVQLILLVLSLIVLARIPTERIRYFPKAAWTIIVIVVNFIGPILFLTTGFSRSETVDHHEELPDSATDIVNTIYADKSSNDSGQKS